MLKHILGQGIVGHAVIIRLLESWLDNPAPGYLFHGPAHLGKSTLAERFVSKLLTAGDQLQTHPDLILLKPEEGKTIIAVDAVREARRRLYSKPFVALRQVMFVPCAEALNTEGLNALLKVLEEPPAAAVFVLVAENPEHLPATVRSRLMQIGFNPVSQVELVVGLEARGLSSEQALERAKQSRGRPGLAMEAFETSAGALWMKRFIGASNLGQRLAMIEELVVDCESAEDANQAWRQMLDQAGTAAHNHFQPKPEWALVAGQGIITARQLVGGPLSPRLALEAAAVRLESDQPLANLFPTQLAPAVPRIFL
jgi:hypothetical protein